MSFFRRLWGKKQPADDLVSATLFNSGFEAEKISYMLIWSSRWWMMSRLAS